MRLRLFIIALLTLVVFVRSDEKPAVLDSSGIVWRPDNTGSASIENWPLNQVLQALSDLRKWQVLVEPDLKASVTTRFKNLPQTDALRRLLNDVNFVIIPSRKGPSRMLVYETSSKNAVRRIVPTKRLAKRDKPEKKDDGKIDNELIVTIDPKSGIDIEALARQLGAKIKGKIDGLDIYQLEFEDAEAADKALAQLEQNAGVASVDSNFTIQQPEHLSLQRNGSQVGDFLLPELSLAGTSANHPGQISHGTSMAETILRGLSASLEGTQETSVKILPVDVYGQYDNTSTFDVARGVQAAIEGGADIISLSLGSDQPNSLLKSVIQAGTKEGVLFLAAAGNEPTGQPVYPAAQKEVIGVTALNRGGQRVASYANYGNFVEAAAPGVGVTVLNNQTFFGTGTSFSTAYTAGVAAGLGATPGVPMSQVRDAITKNMRPPGTGP